MFLRFSQNEKKNRVRLVKEKIPLFYYFLRHLGAWYFILLISLIFFLVTYLISVTRCFSLGFNFPFYQNLIIEIIITLFGLFGLFLDVFYNFNRLKKCRIYSLFKKDNYLMRMEIYTFGLLMGIPLSFFGFIYFTSITEYVDWNTDKISQSLLILYSGIYCFYFKLDSFYSSPSLSGFEICAVEKR